ncbi:MAG TPA: type II secretion system protein GspM [Rhodocyclaceae bacterium]|nr:type II secretion system protein GspM [Rhodocyclaceae bacterium]
MTGLSATWRKLAERYAALNQREQVLVAVASIVGVALLLQTFWVDPAARKANALRAQMSGQQTELATLQTQVASLKAQLQDPDAANRKALEDLRLRLANVDSQIGHLDEKLVSPQQMGRLLQTLLARHRGLSLVSLKSMEPQPLLMAQGDKIGSGKEAPPSENIYRHGVEIRVAGSYLDLLAYLAELERSPQRLLWGGFTLAVVAYPRSELTLTVYTLSREKDWLAV